MNFFATTAAALLAAGAAHAADFSFSGTFSQDDDVIVFDFIVGADSDVVLRSYSYAGGVQANGAGVNSGGFDPILAVFDASGAVLAEQDDAGSDGNDVPADPDTGAPFDVLLEITLAAGDYSVAVSQYDNFAAGSDLSDGFSRTDPTFTSVFGCSNGRFCDATGANRRPFFAFDILNVAGASVGDDTTGGVDIDMSVIPVPAAGWLALLGLGGLGALRRRTA